MHGPWALARVGGGGVPWPRGEVGLDMGGRGSGWAKAPVGEKRCRWSWPAQVAEMAR